jgi:hypothetical protein
LVEIDVTKPLTRTIQIENDTREMKSQPVRYEWVPLYCHTCHKIGHDCSKKTKPAPKGADAIQQKKVTKIWVPKVVVKPSEPGKEEIGQENQPPQEGEVFMTSTTTHTPVPVTDDQDGPWEEVTRKSKRPKVSLWGTMAKTWKTCWRTALGLKNQIVTEQGRPYTKPMIIISWNVRGHEYASKGG